MKPIEIVDHNYVVLTDDTLLHLRTRERVNIEDAVARGIAKFVEDPYKFFGDKSVEALVAATKDDPATMHGMVLGIVREDSISVYMVGLPADLKSAVSALIEAVDQVQPPPPPEQLH